MMTDVSGQDSTIDPDRRGRLSRRALLRLLGGGVGALALGLHGGPGALGLGGGRNLAQAGRWQPANPATSYNAAVPAAWFDLVLDLIRRTPGFSPPVASRALGYFGLTLYEALVPGIPGYRSLAGTLPGLPALGRPDDYAAYHWPTVANSALATAFRELFPPTPDDIHADMTVVEQAFAESFREILSPWTYLRSARRGRDVAQAILAWSLDDGGHEGQNRNFPADYAPPVGPGLWVPTPPGYLNALQPNWGDNRPFVIGSAAEGDPGAPPAYSEEPGSIFYAEAIEVYETVNNLTDEQRAIADFWADDPGLTATPPGHSISILTQVIRQQETSLAVAAEAYAKVGMAQVDAFICCWHTKYRYNLLRPITYIQAQIDPSWGDPLPVTTPPFPEYTSGHSAQSAAAAEVLTALFGEVAFTDLTHERRGFAPRSFNSFWEAAEEAAISRLYGGIHFRAAIELGIDQGRLVGKKVNALNFAAN